jgi:DNA-binding beta-propeller fold protein YncE
LHHRQTEKKVKQIITKALSLLVVFLFLAQASSAAVYPLSITPGRSWPMSVAVDSSRGLVYFDAASGEYPPTGFSFGIINATAHAVIKILPLGVNSGPMVLDQRSGDVYVAGLTSIAVLDGSDQSFVRDIEVGHPILSMAHDGSVSQNLFVTSGNTLFSLNPQTGAIVGNATFANDVDGVVLDPSNGRVFVGEYPAGGISVLDASNLAPVGTIGLPACCALQFALDNSTQTLYASTGTNIVDMINAGTDAFMKSVNVAPSSQNSTNAIAVDDETDRVYVATSPGGSILELNGGSGAVTREFKVSSQVAGLALDVKTQELYATNYHQLTVFDAARSGVFLLLLLGGGAVAAVAAVVVYALVKRRDARERMEIQRGWQKQDSVSRGT